MDHLAMNELAALTRSSLQGRSAVSVLLAELLQREVRRERLEGRDPRDLGFFESQVYSQSGEDGIIEEIFRRIGLTDRRFVEIAAGDGLENNTAKLLFDGWTGLWAESDPTRSSNIRRLFGVPLTKRDLRLHEGRVLAENVDAILEADGTPRQFDLLSIDIDGNDFWLWMALGTYRPRVVVIEYNASFGATTDWVMAYDPQASWKGDNQHGASLKALERLGRRTGYRLVGCNLYGVNAFFVREDCAGDSFLGDGRAETYFHPPAYNAIVRSGHPRTYGPYVRASDILREPAKP